MRLEMDKDQVLGLRELVLDGIESMHAGVEAATRQDVVRRISATQIQSISRGIEVFGKGVFILNSARITGRLPERDSVKRCLGHRVTKIVEAVVEQAAGFGDDDRYDVDFLRNDAVLASILNVCEDFGQGGRYSHIEAVFKGARTLPTYLAWNQVQWDIDAEHKLYNPEHRLHGGSTEYFVHMRVESVRVLQRAASRAVVGFRG